MLSDLATPPRSRRAIWLTCGLLLVLSPLVLIWSIWSCLHTSSDVSALRETAAKASTGQWDRLVEFHAGSVPLALSRFGLGFAPLDPSARLALSAVREVEAAVFSPHGRTVRCDGAAVLTATDPVMHARGWDRIIGVVNPENVVAVYVRDPARRTTDLNACVLVIDSEHLVVASARAQTAPLLELVNQHLPRNRGLALNF